MKVNKCFSVNGGKGNLKKKKTAEKGNSRHCDRYIVQEPGALALSGVQMSVHESSPDSRFYTDPCEECMGRCKTWNQDWTHELTFGHLIRL